MTLRPARFECGCVHDVAVLDPDGVHCRRHPQAHAVSFLRFGRTRRLLGRVAWIGLAVLLSFALAFSVRGRDWLSAAMDVLFLLALPTLRDASRFRFPPS